MFNLDIRIRRTKLRPRVTCLSKRVAFAFLGLNLLSNSLAALARLLKLKTAARVPTVPAVPILTEIG
jgi:hypothetical protein